MRLILVFDDPYIRAYYVDAKVTTDFNNNALLTPFEPISNFGSLKVVVLSWY